MEDSKSSTLLWIVAIVAVVGIVAMVISSSGHSVGVSLPSADSAGNAMATPLSCSYTTTHCAGGNLEMCGSCGCSWMTAGGLGTIDSPGACKGNW